MAKAITADDTRRVCYLLPRDWILGKSLCRVVLLLGMLAISASGQEAFLSLNDVMRSERKGLNIYMLTSDKSILIFLEKMAVTCPEVLLDILIEGWVKKSYVKIALVRLVAPQIAHRYR